jgi:hypothetical protein
MTASTRIYAGGAIAFGGQPAINDLLAAGYSTVIVWSVHVTTDGTLILNDTQIVSGGVYKEPEPMNLPSRLAQLHKAGVEIIFSVGAGGTYDFTNIAALLGGKPGGPGNVIYDNFQALKQAMVAAGGDIDAIDFDNEDNPQSEVMVNFAITLANIGYAHVTFCPYADQSMWYDTMKALVAAQGSDFVNAIHLQCYSGGGWNVDQVSDWVNGFKNAGGNALMIPGLATNQAAPGPWWYDNAMGANVITVPNVAMYGEANWDNYLYTQNFASVDDALKAAQTAASFFFYCRGTLILSNGRSFQAGDTVFFTGVPWWGSAPQCDAYYLGGPCNNPYNPPPLQACPADLQAQYKTWGSSIDGGFIWLYDSIISCLLSGCCGGSMDKPAATALAYRQAITNGLS